MSDNEVKFEEGQTIDMSAVEAASYEVLPKGTYNVIVSEAEGKMSSSDNPMISLQLEVEDGDFAGRKLFTHVVFSPKALAGAKASMITLGLEELAQSPGLNPLDPDVAHQFLGLRARALVAIDKYDGADTNKVKRLLKAV